MTVTELYPRPAPGGVLVYDEPPAAAPWVPPTWDEVVEQHSARVFRLAYRLTGNRHDAEDLTQEVFIRVFRSLSSYTPGTFEGWLHRITTNLFLDGVRRRARIRFEALPEDWDERITAREPSPDRLLDDAMLDADIQTALDALPPDFRAAVVLCDIEGLTYEEIAATLGIKLGTVRSRIHRGRAQLRAALEHRAPTRHGVAAEASAGRRAPSRSGDDRGDDWRGDERRTDDARPAELRTDPRAAELRTDPRAAELRPDDARAAELRTDDRKEAP